MSNLRIKQITLPSGNTYLIYDEATRDMITSKEYTTGVAYSVGDLVVYEDNLYRVTVAISAQDNTGWSAVSKSQTTIDSELATIRESVTQVMKYRGVTTTELTDGSTTATITINGQSVTFTAADAGSVVISDTGADQKEFVWSGTIWNEFGSTGALKALAFKDSASGTYDKTTSITLTVPTVSATTQKLSATATNGAATITSTAAAVTGYSSPTTSNFVTSYPGATSKLEKTTVPNVTSAGTASTWTFTVTSETLSISGTNGSAPTLGTAIGVATGSISSNGTGDSVMTGLGTASTSSAITALGDPTTANCATAISLSTQPTVTLNLDDSTGDVTVATGVSTSGSASATPNHTSTTITVS